jgi:hypothetical protein
MPVTSYCATQDVIDCCTWPAFGQVAASAQTRLIAAASGRVDKECRRPLGLQAQNVTEYFGGPNRQSLWLKTRPVISVQMVTVNGTCLDNTYGDAWSFNPRTGRLIRGNGQDDSHLAPWFPAGMRNIVVQYFGGYDTFPDTLVMATAWMVRWMYERGSVTGVYKSESIGDWSGTVNDGGTSNTVPSHIMDLLVDYIQDDAF